MSTEVKNSTSTHIKIFKSRSYCGIFFNTPSLYQIFVKIVIIKSTNTFGRNERLKSRKLIGELFNNGNSFSSGPLKGLYMLTPAQNPELKCGFTVSSRSFKKAVERNRIKRLMRETYRTQKEELQNLVTDNKFSMSIFIIFRGKELPDFKTINEKMGDMVKKLLKLAVERAPQNT